jgi:hypothetical protein
LFAVCIEEEDNSFSWEKGGGTSESSGRRMMFRNTQPLEEKHEIP